jgi:FKBP12-rapamycin complex-associated protein
MHEKLPAVSNSNDLHSIYRALEVINRIQAKLTGRDFLKIDDDESDDFTIEEQVDRLIKEATSIENLCQLFTGWCPLW